jgi:hypothetical protein
VAVLRTSRLFPCGLLLLGLRGPHADGGDAVAGRCPTLDPHDDHPVAGIGQHHSLLLRNSSTGSSRCLAKVAKPAAQRTARCGGAGSSEFARYGQFVETPAFLPGPQIHRGEAS